MYKGTSQNSQRRAFMPVSRDTAAVAGQEEFISKNQRRKNFAHAMGELDRQIVMASPARKKILGLKKQELQRVRELEKGIGIGGGKVNRGRIDFLFRKMIFDLLPDDAQRLWDKAASQEAEEREVAMRAMGAVSE